MNDQTLVFVLTGVIGVNVVALFRWGYNMGRLAQRVDHIEKLVEQLIHGCPYCQVGARASNPGDEDG